MTANFVVSPSSEVFDVQGVRDFLDSRPDAVQIPGDEDTYLLAGHPVAAEHLLQFWKREKRLPYAAAAFLEPHQIIIHHEYARRDQEWTAMELLRWLTKHYDCRIREDGYADLTEKARQQGVESLYPADIRDAAPPWHGELIQLGFFMEVFDSRGGVMGGNLKDCIADTPQEDEDKLVAYLQAGRFYRAFGDPEEELYDVLDTSAEMNIKPALLTDGTYVWATDLPYYVARYHARLPRSFLLHARNHGWQVPQDLDVSSLKMLDA